MTAHNIRSRKSGRKPQPAGQGRNEAFVRVVLDHYKAHARHNLPWRKITDPYKILVSEVMLQQTQVDRVIPYYKEFLKKFPTVRRLAAAPLSDVLRVWQGLGYNRRAKMLHDAAKAIVQKHSGHFPEGRDALMTLPGIGSYTAGAVRVFAFNEPEILLETNIRTVYLHHFFSKKKNVHDEAVRVLIKVPSRVEPKKWYAALMDYGSYLKKTLPNPSRRSRHHTKQKPFLGSDREIRGTLLRVLAFRPQRIREMLKLPFTAERIKNQLTALSREGLVQIRRQRYSLKD